MGFMSVNGLDQLKDLNVISLTQSTKQKYDKRTRH
jgi:hypothetical protein